MNLSRLGIRQRILGGSALVSVATSVIAGVVLGLQIDRILRENTTQVARSATVSYLTEFRTEPDSVSEEALDAPGPGQLIAVVRDDDPPVLNTLPAPVTARLSDIIPLDGAVVVRDGDASWLAVSGSQMVDGVPWHVVSAVDLAAEDATRRELIALLVGGLLLINLAAAVAAASLVTVSLRPVTRLRESAEAMSAAPEGPLLPVGGAPDEIARLATTLNDLIRRLRASAVRERQMVSDASHELRTPLAILRTRLELARSRAGDVDQLTRDVEAAERDVERLSELVTSMLELSAFEAAGRPGTASGAELADELTDVVERARIRTRETAVVIEHEETVSGDARFAVSPEDFGRAVENLVTNALTAVQGDGRLTLTLDVSAERAGIRVTDTGVGMDPGFVPHAFERFRRGEPARSGSGAGLGLPIVAAIAAQAGGTARIENDPGRGLTVVVELPAV